MGDLDYDLHKFSHRKLLNNTADHVAIIAKPPHISGSLIDHVCNKETLMKEFSTNVVVESIYFCIMILQEL